ncbi:MAG TPA: ABC transporter ATP-binding protein [Saprospiraceae bacterium]|nr:ABC transporter ATP-binding protein [Saprospiraceae bacterium]HMX87782.1 ABC transporter ATP-binding protein [Saprospiraceae bacterium]HMZ39358.1 ABC transporter ATP-binding protein [Saprospiraceae bacterium]HNA64292.1 ABC transporter ATP-binding protein [Saprospiraceae bacterium]HNC36969.1 ABC transporter ATP-binding protein [Saprospiraceae bacterium]
MKAFFIYISQIRQYKGLVILHFIFYFLTAIFTVASIPAIIPLFEMLFLEGEIKVKAPDQLHNIGDYLSQLKYEFSVWLNAHDKADAVLLICGVIGLIFLFKNFFKYLAVYFITPVRANLIRDTREKLFGKMLDLPLSYFSDERKGDLIARVTTDVAELEFTLLSSMESLVKDPLIIIGSLIFMLYTSASLTLFVLILLVVTSLIIGGISRTLKKKSLNAQQEFGDLISLLEESLGGLRVIKVFGAESYVKSRYNNILNKYRSMLININRRREMASPLSEFLGIVIVCILLWFGAKEVFAKHIEASTFLAFLYAFFNVIEPSKALSAAYFNIHKGMAALERINQVLHVENKISDTPQAKYIDTFEHEIEFNHVFFSYPNQSESAIRDVSFKINKGETIAIVGASGSGKSTLVDLLARFHDVSSGSILIDGLDLRCIKISGLRKMMGMVTQEPILFNDTIRRNIEFSAERTDDGTLNSVLDASYATEFVQNENRGLDSSIGDRGSKLSGGQRQRLTLARAILRNPQILILDEATSALDSASETAIQAALVNVLKDRTAIVIAHRLSTIKNADKILVMKDGQLLDAGTHEELLGRNAEYCNFVELQTLV